MLKSKTAIVTGSTSGIGLAIAKALAHAGADVWLNGLGTDAEIQAALDGVKAVAQGQVHYHGADMRAPDEIRDMAAQAGDVDILVNNAGIQHVSPLEDFADDKWDDVIAINMSSAFHASKAVLAGMKARGYGRIVNIASIHGLTASPFKAAYVTAKHGIVGLTRTVALEGAEFGVTCNAICPGYVKTPLVMGQIPDAAKANNMSEDQVIRDVMLARQPTKKFVEPEEVAALTVFLCGDLAKSITGTALPVDGGWSAL